MCACVCLYLCSCECAYVSMCTGVCLHSYACGGEGVGAYYVVPSLVCDIDRAFRNNDKFEKNKCFKNNIS